MACLYGCCSPPLCHMNVVLHACSRNMHVQGPPALQCASPTGRRHRNTSGMTDSPLLQWTSESQLVFTPSLLYSFSLPSEGTSVGLQGLLSDMSQTWILQGVWALDGILLGLEWLLVTVGQGRTKRCPNGPHESHTFLPAPTTWRGPFHLLMNWVSSLFTACL